MPSILPGRVGRLCAGHLRRPRFPHCRPASGQRSRHRGLRLGPDRRRGQRGDEDRHRNGSGRHRRRPRGDRRSPSPASGSIAITSESPAAADGGTASATISVSDRRSARHLHGRGDRLERRRDAADRRLLVHGHGDRDQADRRDPGLGRPGGRRLAPPLALRAADRERRRSGRRDPGRHLPEDARPHEHGREPVRLLHPEHRGAGRRRPVHLGRDLDLHGRLPGRAERRDGPAGLHPAGGRRDRPPGQRGRVLQLHAALQPALRALGRHGARHRRPAAPGRRRPRGGARRRQPLLGAARGHACARARRLARHRRARRLPEHRGRGDVGRPRRQ